MNINSTFSGYFVSDVWIPFLAALAACIALLIATLIYQTRKRRKIRESIFDGHFLPEKTFERNWIVGGSRGKKGLTGYKYEDGPGCYVILIFNHPVADNDYANYDDVYIGQSVNVCKRVHNHFNGKGNGDVYADVRNGKYAYVQFQRCQKSQMNALEKSLIDAFHATASYNNTKGGGTAR